MRKRYFTMRRHRPRSEYGDADATEYLARTVHEPDPEPYESGILDSQGNPLYVTNEIDQIGFIRRG